MLSFKITAKELLLCDGPKKIKRSIYFFWSIAKQMLCEVRDSEWSVTFAKQELFIRNERSEFRITFRAWRCLGLLRFVTPELKPNIVTVVDCDYKC